MATSSPVGGAPLDQPAPPAAVTSPDAPETAAQRRYRHDLEQLLAGALHNLDADAAGVPRTTPTTEEY